MGLSSFFCYRFCRSVNLSRFTGSKLEKNSDAISFNIFVFSSSHGISPRVPMMSHPSNHGLSQ